MPQDRFAEARPGEPLGTPHAASEFIDPCPEAVWLSTPQRADARINAAESVTLAFMSALEHLPAQQRAVLILRDVLDFSAAETADLLGKSSSAVESTLDRARETISVRREKPSTMKHPDLLGRYVRAWEKKDATALSELLREDALLAMPPLPAWFRGRDAIVAFVRGLMPALGELVVRPIAICGGEGVAVWARADGEELYAAASISVLRIEGEHISSIQTWLAPQLFASFNLPSAIARADDSAA